DSTLDANDARIEHRLLEQARVRRRTAAIIDGDRALSYEELTGVAGAVAHSLSTAGVVPGDRVAVFLEKGTPLVAAIYGAWFAGPSASPTTGGLAPASLPPRVRGGGGGARARAAAALAPIEDDASGAALLVAVVLDGRPRPPPGLSLAGGPAPAAILYTSGS